VNAPFQSPQIVDNFADCPAPLDDDGRAGWPEIHALKNHIMLVRLTAELEALRNSQPYCNTCGEQPCVNPSFCAASRAADQKIVRQRPRAEQRPTPPAMIEAIMHCVRERGSAALRERKNLDRLARCDAKALAQIDARLAKLKGDNR
jgi:hypothetical protein